MGPASALGSAQCEGGLRVGVFDAGIGGLPFARELIGAVPEVSICYLADSSRRPYGPQPLADVAGYVLQAENFFVRQGVDAWVIACNTASVVAPKAHGPSSALRRYGRGDRSCSSRCLGQTDRTARHPGHRHQRGDPPTVPRPDVGGHRDGTAAAIRRGRDRRRPRGRRSAHRPRYPTRRTGTRHAVLACTDYTCVLPTMTARLPDVELLDPLCGAVQAIVDLLPPAPDGVLSGCHELHDTGVHPVDIGRLAEQTYGFTFSTVTLHQN